LYAWNPNRDNVWPEQSRHRQGVFLLLAGLALAREKSRMASVALGISALVKLITLLLIAIYWLALLRARAKRELATSILVLGLITVASNEIIQLPMLFPAPRFYLQLLFVCVSTLGLTGRRCTTRRSTNPHRSERFRWWVHLAQH
jgi:hypothetical protein